MSEKAPVPAPMLGEKREQTIQALIQSFAADRLSVEEFERRLDQAHRAVDLTTLAELVQDLPATPAPATPAKGPATLPARPRPPLPDEVRDRGFLVGILGGFDKKGPWTPARHTFILAMLGGGTLDFREARLLPGVTEIDIFAFCGGVEIIVSPGMVVDCSGIAIMGGFEHGSGSNAQADPDAPVIKVSGMALMGGVEIIYRLPGETAKDARVRLRQERKQLRSGRRDRS
ncbi:MAG: DUF1707 SHOCT-like domain-containing protein [Longimicrobiales bacterium]